MACLALENVGNNKFTTCRRNNINFSEFIFFCDNHFYLLSFKLREQLKTLEQEFKNVFPTSEIAIKYAIQKNQLEIASIIYLHQLETGKIHNEATVDNMISEEMRFIKYVP